MPAADGKAQLEVRTAAELVAWLRANNRQRESVWLVTWKKSSGGPHVPRRSILEALLAYGWIDSLPRKLDDERTMLLISPRQPGSSWSKVNRDIVEDLDERGALRAPGRRAVEQAKADGSWSRLDEVEQGLVPDDLAEALERTPKARAHFDRFPRSSRRGILEWIQSAKRPEARARRVAETAEKAARNIKANHPKGRDRGPPPPDGS